MGSGRIDLYLPYLVTVVASVALVTDAWRGRIYNALTLPVILVGLTLQALSGGWTGAQDALLGIGAGLGLYGWMYLLGFLGAGDVKLLMAFGALGGLHFVWEVALLGVVFGGVMAAFHLAVRGKLPSFLRRMKEFIYTLLVKELERVPPKIDKSLRMPFGIPMALAAIWRVWGGVSVSGVLWP